MKKTGDKGIKTTGARKSKSKKHIVKKSERAKFYVEKAAPKKYKSNKPSLPSNMPKAISSGFSVRITPKGVIIEKPKARNSKSKPVKKK